MFRPFPPNKTMFGLNGFIQLTLKMQIGRHMHLRHICQVKDILKSFYTEDKLSAMSSYSVKAVYGKIRGEQERVLLRKFV